MSKLLYSIFTRIIIGIETMKEKEETKYQIPKGFIIKAQWKEKKHDFIIAVKKNGVFIERKMFVFSGISNFPDYIVNISF